MCSMFGMFNFMLKMHEKVFSGSAMGRALDLRSIGFGFKSYLGQHCAAGKVTAGLAESNGSLPQDSWLTVTCGLTAFTPGSAPGPTLGIKYGKPFPFTFTQAVPGPIGRACTGWPQTWKNLEYWGILWTCKTHGILREFCATSGKIITNKMILVRSNICIKQLLTG